MEFLDLFLRLVSNLLSASLGLDSVSHLTDSGSFRIHTELKFVRFTYILLQ